MYKLIRFLILLLIIAGAAFTGTLFSVEPEERPQMIAALKAFVGLPMGDRLNEVKQQVEKIVPAEFVESFKEVRLGESFQPVASCGKTKTTALEKSSSSEIYRWVDEQGSVHFSDAKPGATRNSEVMSVSYPDRQQYFSLNLNDDAASLPAFTRDRVSADMHQVYRILSGDLDIEHLRKVFLNVRVFAQQADFQQYKQLRAPRLRTNSGFYTSDNNEAVVFQGNNPEQMRAVIRHEATHVMMAGLYGATPSWFNEGLAEYFEQLQLSGQSRQVNPVGYHWQYLQHRSQQGALMTLRDYINLQPAQWYAGNLRDNYGMAWSLVYFLMEHKTGQQFLKGMMNEMAENYCWSVHGSEYFDRHYPGGLQAFESAWKRWLSNSMPAPHRY